MKILLANECYCSAPAVHPKNWQNRNACVNIKWYISYRFYDPLRVDASGNIKPRQVIIKGMNEFFELSQRQAATKKLLENELFLLKDCNYNPFTGQYITPPEEIIYEIDPLTPLTKALNLALEKLTIEPHTKEDIKSVIKYFNKACALLRYDQIPISNVQRRHIRNALDNCASLKREIKYKGGKTKVVNKIWNENQFNHYRKYLHILFDQLEELDAIEHNPVTKIKTKKHEIKKRKILSWQQRELVYKAIKPDPLYYRFVEIFFHSGSREIELLKVKKCDVDLDQQKFRATVKKGNSFRQCDYVIKDVALTYWKELMAVAKDDEYIFGTNLIPGPIACQRDFVTRRWKKYVKDPLGIEADLYALKALNLNEIAAVLNMKAAAKMAGHSTPVITMKHYAFNEAQRLEDEENEQLKKVNNSFSGEA